jgi:hypothetical protein
MIKCSIKIYLEKDVVYLKKKPYACWLNFVENYFFATHVNPRKLLEKSGTKS